MFTGESAHTLDAKNRVFVPKRIQSHLERDADGNLAVVLTRGFEDCVFLYSAQGWQEAVGRMVTQAFAGKDQRKMQRLFFGSAHEAQLDGSGRVVLPEKLRTRAKIDKEVVIVGIADRVEIWDKQAWDAYEAEHGDDYDDLDVVLVGGGGGGPEGDDS